MKCLDEHCDLVRIMSFDFSKVFDMVTHRIVSDKLKLMGVDSYIGNWVTDFLTR